MSLVHKNRIIYSAFSVLLLTPLMFQAAPTATRSRNLEKRVRTKFQDMLERSSSLVSSAVSDIVANKQARERAEISSNLQENDECYNSLNGDIETYTTLDWWNSQPTKGFTPERTSFLRNRLKYEPLQNSDTMIAGVLFSFSNYTLKMSVLFPPLYPQESRYARVFVMKKGTGEFVARRDCIIIPNIWKCTFRVNKPYFIDEDKDQEYTYEIFYEPNLADDGIGTTGGDATILYTYNGIIPAPPSNNNPRIVGLSCFGHDTKTEKDSLVAAVMAVQPDLIVLQGDQTYYHDDLGFGFLELVYSINEMTRSIPTIVQMDDHDYGEGNLWGADHDRHHDSGAGFSKPVCLINAIQDLYMGHNPDPATDLTLQNGITIHYTNYILGGVDFAVLEGRKFKSRRIGGSLLGDEQELWLQDMTITTMIPVSRLSLHRLHLQSSLPIGLG